LADLVVGSAEFRNLLKQQRDTFLRLRSIKEVLRIVSRACHGQLPQQYLDEISRGEPMEVRVGFGLDEAFVGAWRDALDNLLKDPDADLPS
jgi:hypothetical protein